MTEQRPFRLRRRRESITALEVIEKLKERGMALPVRYIENVLDEMCGGPDERKI